MKKKKHKSSDDAEAPIDTELLRMYLMGAANPSKGSKISYSEDVIDLHLHDKHVGPGKIEPENALFFQLDKFEAALDKAIAAGKMEFRVVHGLGKGKLKAEIEKILRKNPNVRSFNSDYDSKYGYGSTLVLLK